MISLLSTVIRAVAMGAANELARGAPNVKSLLDPSTYNPRPPAPVPEKSFKDKIRNFLENVMALIRCLAILAFCFGVCYLIFMGLQQQKDDAAATVLQVPMAPATTTSSNTTSNNNDNQFSQAEQVESHSERTTESPQNDWVPLSSGTLY